jgi:putative transposase
MSPGRHYPTDITAEQWELLTPLLPQPKWHPGGPGRPPYELRRVLNGIFYVTKTGCQWRMLPLDFGHWNTIYSYFREWRRTGLWARLLEQLRQRERRRQGWQPEPSAGSIDSQSIKNPPPLWLDRVTWEEESQPPFSSLGAKAGREVLPGPQRTRAL